MNKYSGCNYWAFFRERLPQGQGSSRSCLRFLRRISALKAFKLVGAVQIIDANSCPSFQATQYPAKKNKKSSWRLPEGWDENLDPAAEGLRCSMGQERMVPTNYGHKNNICNRC